ncbi:MAG: PASTA domain-containing protein [Spirochaetaceae bacterium]|nr:PASTA domain-containing protein [Spirochaetaceae bacterium]
MNKTKNIFSKLRFSLQPGEEGGQLTGSTLFFICLTAILLMMAITAIVFFVAVKGSEEVLVPNVIGLPLEEGLLEMQVKELYPKIQLRYSDVPGDEGMILEQNPVAGTIVKASRRIDLVVSRGVVVDQIEDYTGMKLDDLRIKLQTLFSGTRTLITIAEPLYKADQSEAGTILSQNPPPGTQISQPVELELVVSRGPSYEQTRVPNLVGMTVQEILAQMSRSKIAFNFSARPATQEETAEGKAGTIVTQAASGEFIPNYGRLAAEFAFPTAPVNGNSYGIFTLQLPAYPYALNMEVRAVTPNGTQTTLTSFTHPGGQLTVPYALPKNSQLILLVEGRETARAQVQ